MISNDWYYYNHKCVVFQPRHMTPEQLQDGYRHVLKSFYSPLGVARHVAWSLGMTPLIPKRILFFILWNAVNRAFVKELDGVTVIPQEGTPYAADSRAPAWNWGRKADA